MLPTNRHHRKEIPIARGCLDYFPDAIAAVAHVSFVGNKTHNPGEEMHWAREKSNDHADCVARHLAERGTIDEDGLRHSAKLAWRALALLQLEIEEAAKKKYPEEGCRPDNPMPSPVIQPVPGEDYNETLKKHGFTEATPGIPYPIDLNEHEHKPDPRKPLAYLAGPMTGRPDNNFPAFDAAKKRVEAAGYEVISPADQDRSLDKGEHKPITEYIKRNTETLLNLERECRPGSCIVMLPGYQESNGSMFEYYTARRLKLPIRLLEEFKNV